MINPMSLWRWTKLVTSPDLSRQISRVDAGDGQVFARFSFNCNNRQMENVRWSRQLPAAGTYRIQNKTILRTSLSSQAMSRAIMLSKAALHLLVSPYRVDVWKCLFSEHCLRVVCRMNYGSGSKLFHILLSLWYNIVELSMSNSETPAENQYDEQENIYQQSSKVRRWRV